MPAVVLGLLLGSVGPVQAGEDPLRDGRKAAEHLTFEALVRVVWVDAVGPHETTLQVSSDRGRVRIDGRPWTSGPTDLDLPPAALKYEVSTGPGPLVAGRPTTVVELWRAGVLRERLGVDQATGLVLSREQLGPAGLPVRVVTVLQLAVADTPPRARPPTERDPEARTKAAPPRLYRTPAELTGGYRRLAAFRRGAIVHVLYSDGLHGISVFAEPGRLDDDRLPAGGRVIRVGGRNARSYAWPGGEAVTWAAGGVVYTLVGDGPGDELLAAAASLPAPGPPSLLGRLKQASRTMAELLTGGGP